MTRADVRFFAAFIAWRIARDAYFAMAWALLNGHAQLSRIRR